MSQSQLEAKKAIDRLFQDALDASEQNPADSESARQDRALKVLGESDQGKLATPDSLVLLPDGRREDFTGIKGGGRPPEQTSQTFYFFPDSRARIQAALRDIVVDASAMTSSQQRPLRIGGGSKPMRLV